MAKESADIGREHGQQRAHLEGYTLDEVIVEYRLLRRVIFEQHEAEVRLGAMSAQLIHDAIDRGIANSVTEFVSEASTREQRFQTERERLFGDLRALFTVTLPGDSRPQ